MARQLQKLTGMLFKNRKEAGSLLAERLRKIPLENPIVLALPRGGVPVAYEIAEALKAPLEVFIVRKIGAPFQPELGIGATAEGGGYWLDPKIVHFIETNPSDLEEIVEKEQKEVLHRIQLYRENRPLPSLHGRSVILVDDGLATGITARVAATELKQLGPKEIILAVPVCAPSSAEILREEVDQLVCLAEPPDFYGVGQFYSDFSQLSHEEVVTVLREAREREQEKRAIPREVIVQDGVALDGLLSVPPYARGIVLFAHGSGSSRLSPRNQQVASALNEARIGTLLFDLLTPEEARDRRNVFDIPLLGERLLMATRWLRNRTEYVNIPIGYFGASTGAAAAVWAAAELDGEISAVVSRGGRPDLAPMRLPQVEASTLLIVGDRDHPVLEMNQDALRHLKRGSLVTVPGATHLFEEPGALDQVEKLATEFFIDQFKNTVGQVA